VKAGKEMDEIDDHEIEERDVTAQEQHRDDDHDGRVG
jgi:hypothetical protein